MAWPFLPSTGPVQLTFEFDGSPAGLTLWYTHVPVLGETIALALSEWTVVRVDHETIAMGNRLVTLTRFVLGDERLSGTVS